MKHIAYIALALFYITLAPACEKTKTSHSYTENKLNGKAWESDNASLKLYENNKIGLVFQKYKKVDGIDVVWYTLGIINFEQQLGKQRLYYFDFNDTSNTQTSLSYGVYTVSQDDGDVGCDLLLIHEADSVNNWVEITEQENNFMHIKGRYSMTLTKWQTCDASVTADTVVVREGTFDVYLD